MPDIVQWLRLKGDSSGLQKAADQAGESLTKSFLKANIATQAVTKSAQFLTEMIRDGAKAALEYEKTTTKLTTALKIQGSEVDNTLEGLQAAAGRFEELSGISDEVIRTYQAQAIALGKTGKETNDLINASLALSQVTGRDLRTSFEAMLKLETGLVDRTVKLVPEIANLTKEQLKAGDAVAVMNEKYSEFISLGTSGGYGALTRLQNEFANVGEEIAKLGNEEDGFIVQMNRALGDLFEWQRRIVADSSLSQFERIAFMFAPIFAPEAAAEYQANLKRAEEYARQMVDIQAKIDKREGRGPAARPAPSAKKGSGKKEVDAFDELWAQSDDLVFERQEELREQALQNERDYQELRFEIGKAADEKRLAWLEERNQYQIDLDRKMQKDQLEIQEETFNTTAASYDALASVTQSALGMALDAVVKLSADTKLVVADLAIGVLKGVGKELVGMGGAYILKGIARGFEYRGLDPTAWGMIKVGGSMVAMGTGLMAGVTAVGNAFGFGGGGGSSSAGGGAGAGRSGVSTTDAGQLATRDRRQDTETRRGPENITIVFQGPTTPEGIGVAVNDALQKARARGLIG